ncbi:hypothetical protein PGB90_001087 [Kerria lacca]
MIRYIFYRVTLNEFIKYYEPAFYDAKEVSNQHKRIKREAENYEESRTFLKLTISTSDSLNGKHLAIHNTGVNNIRHLRDNEYITFERKLHNDVIMTFSLKERKEEKLILMWEQHTLEHSKFEYTARISRLLENVFATSNTDVTFKLRFYSFGIYHSQTALSFIGFAGTI